MLRGSEVEGKRSRAGTMASSFWKVCRFAVHTRTGGLRFFWFFHPETCFQKSAFSGAAFSGSVCKVEQNDAIHVRFCKRALSCGRPLRSAETVATHQSHWRLLCSHCNHLAFEKTKNEQTNILAIGNYHRTSIWMPPEVLNTCSPNRGEFMMINKKKKKFFCGNYESPKGPCIYTFYFLCFSEITGSFSQDFEIMKLCFPEITIWIIRDLEKTKQKFYIIAGNIIQCNIIQCSNVRGAGAYWSPRYISFQSQPNTGWNSIMPCYYR